MTQQESLFGMERTGSESSKGEGPFERQLAEKTDNGRALEGRLWHRSYQMGDTWRTIGGQMHIHM